MTTMLEAIQNVVATEPDTEFQPDPAQPDDVAVETKLNVDIRIPAQAYDAAIETEPTEEMKVSHPEGEPASQGGDVTAENQLTAEISELWGQHIDLSGTRKATAKELRLLQTKLAERFYAMKQLLSRPGRGGQWRSWLKERGIPRSSADRLCARHVETLGIENGNAPSDAINLGEDTVVQLVETLLPRLRSKLPDVQAVFRFIAAVAGAFNLVSETTEDCIMVSQPKPEQSETSPSATGAPEAASPDAMVLETENSSDGIAVQAETAGINGGSE